MKFFLEKPYGRFIYEFKEKKKKENMKSKLECTVKLKMNGYTFQGEQLHHFHFCNPTQWIQLLKERICSSRSKFFTLRVDPTLGLLHQGNQAGSYKSWFPSEKGWIKKSDDDDDDESIQIKPENL